MVLVVCKSFCNYYNKISFKIGFCLEWYQVFSRYVLCVLGILFYMQNKKKKERIINVFDRDNFPRKKSWPVERALDDQPHCDIKLSLVNKYFWKSDIQGPPPVFLSHRMWWLLLKCSVTLNNWQSLNVSTIIWTTLHL